jgi:hypothetical protein
LVQALLAPGWDPEAFDGGPVLSSTGKHRFYVADRAGSAAFTAALLAAVPEAAALLALSIAYAQTPSASPSASASPSTTTVPELSRVRCTMIRSAACFVASSLTAMALIYSGVRV